MSHLSNDYHFVTEYDPTKYLRLRSRLRRSFVFMIGMAVITAVLLITMLTQFWTLVGALPSLILLVIAVGRFAKAYTAFRPYAAVRTMVNTINAFFQRERGVHEYEYPSRLSFWLDIQAVSDGSGDLEVKLMPRDGFMIPQEFLVGPTRFATRRGADLAIIFPLIQTALSSFDIVGEADAKLGKTFLTKLVDAEQAMEVARPILAGQNSDSVDGVAD